MSANTEQRKLAAIVFTDMVDYTVLAQRHEAVAPKRTTVARGTGKSGKETRFEVEIVT